MKLPEGIGAVVRVSDCLYNSVCVIRVQGYMATPGFANYFLRYLTRKINAGVRFFILDCKLVTHIDSSGIGSIVNMATRASMRSGTLVLASTDTIGPVLTVTRLAEVLPTTSDIGKAFQTILGQTTLEIPELNFEERFLLKLETTKTPMKVLVPDKDDEPAIEKLNESILEPSPASQEKLSIRGMAGVAIVSLVILALLAYGLVWVTKEVSSVLVVVLIFCVALLFALCLLGFVLLLSGHLTEETVGKLFMGILGKIPNLGIWVPRTRSRKTKSRPN